jgi:hypothetical protein
VVGRIIGRILQFLGLAGVPGDINLWWNVVIPAIPTVLVGLIAYLQQAPLLYLVLLVIGVYIFAVLVSIPVTRRRVRMSEQENARQSEGPQERRDTYSAQSENQSGGQTTGYQDNRSVTSHNQMGGQTGFKITNEGLQPREVSEASADALVEELLKYPAEQCSISVAASAWDGEQLAYRLANILDSAGWSVSFGTLNAVLNPPPPAGITVVANSECSQARVLIDWLGRVGLDPISNFDANAQRIELGIGAQVVRRRVQV